MAAKGKQASLGQEVDKLDKLRRARQEKNKELEAAKKAEKEQEEYVMEMLKSQRLDKASGQAITASITKSEVTRVNDWQKVEQFAKRNNALYIFQRRLSEPSVRELVQNRKGKPLPGTEMVEIEKLSVNSR